MDKLEFCQKFAFLKGEPISFAGRPYLPAIYAASRGNLILRASRQVEKSTFLANTIAFECLRKPGIEILFVAPRAEQSQLFSNVRLVPLLEQSPLLRRGLLGRKARVRVSNMTFSNGSRIHLRAAYRSADACRGLSADILLIDELQDIAAGDVPVIQEVLSHAPNPRIIMAGTPKMVDNHLEGFFNQSTANIWTMWCYYCDQPVTIDERSLGAVSLVCPDCGNAVDPNQGIWWPRNPSSRWGQGYSVSHPMVPWLSFDDVLDRLTSYDPVRFRNEVLGLPTTLGEHVVTRGELEACCVNRPVAQSWHDIPANQQHRLVAGIDWGGGVASRTVITIGAMREDFVFEVFHWSVFRANEDPNLIIREVARICQTFRVAAIAADGGGNGFVYNRLLCAQVQPRSGFYAIVYSSAESKPTPDGVLSKWTVHRSSSIGILFGRVKRQTLQFPTRDYSDPYLDEFACETTIYDDANRDVKYTHPETQPDDCLHSTNYALLIATRGHRPAGVFQY